MMEYQQSIEKGVWKFPYEIFISVMLTRKDTLNFLRLLQLWVSEKPAEYAENIS